MEKEKEEKKKPFFKKKRFWLSLYIIFAIGGFAYYKLKIAKSSGAESTQVKRGTVEEVLTLSGEITADEYAKLIFPVSGEISWVGVKEGDEVKKGQALAKLDTTVLNSAYQSARATLRAAEATVDNVHDQVKDHSGDETFAQKDARTTAEVVKDKAYEAYIAAQYNLRNSTLTAPFAGIVTYLAHPFSGANIFSTETQVELINPSTMYFDVSADQSEVLKIFIGQDVEIHLDSVSDERIKGKVSFIGYTPKAGEVGTIYKVKVAFDETPDIKKYRIGLTGDAIFVTSKAEDVLYVPSKYIKSDPDGDYVRRSEKNGKTHIETGLEGEDSTEIVSGDVREGDTVYD